MKKLLLVFAIIPLLFSTLPASAALAAPAAGAPTITLTNLKYQSSVADQPGTYGTFSFDVNNTGASQLLISKIDFILPISADLSSQFPSWAFIDFSPNSSLPYISNVSIKAHSTYHVSGRYQLFYSWNHPAMDDCVNNMNLSFIISTLVDYGIGQFGKMGKLYSDYKTLLTARDASKIIKNTALARTSATFTLTPRVTVNGVVIFGSSFRVVSTVPLAKQNKFLTGEADEINGLIVGIVPAPPPYDAIATLSGADIYILGCNIAIGSIIP